jgi:hypothetical protein
MNTGPGRKEFSNDFLLTYSDEHVVYEYEMFLWLAWILGKGARLETRTPEDAIRLNNVLIEAFVVHLRNVIVFLFDDRPEPSDVVAADFFAMGEWTRLRGKIPPILKSARIRANKEVSHITTGRHHSGSPKKHWDVVALSNVLVPTMRLMAENAMRDRLSPRVSQFFRVP